MKTRILFPLFATLIFTGVAQAETPDKPRPDGPPPGGPMADRLKERLEQLHRDGKHEEAERLQHHAREMWEQHRGNSQGRKPGNPQEEHGGMPPASPGERAGHLAEGAKHLRAAGIEVSPEMLEKLGSRFHGKMGHHAQGSAGEHSGSMPGRRPFPPMAGAAPGAGSPLEAMHNEIRTLARQVQELRGMMQQQRGGDRPSARPSDSRRDGEPSRGQHDQNFHRPNAEEHHGDKAQGEPRKDHGPGPDAAREHHDGPPKQRGDKEGENHPRGEGRPPGGPGNPGPSGDRPHRDAPVPPPAG